MKIVILCGLLAFIFYRSCNSKSGNSGNFVTIRCGGSTKLVNANSSNARRDCNDDSTTESTAKSTAKTSEELTTSSSEETSTKSIEYLNTESTTKTSEESSKRRNEESSTRRNEESSTRRNEESSTRRNEESSTESNNYLSEILGHLISDMSNSGGNDIYKVTKNIETLLESMSVTKTTTISGKNYVVMLYKHTNPFNGAVFYASETQADSDKPVYNPTITVQLPGELNLSKTEDMIAFINLKLSDWNDSFPPLNENRLVGLSVKNRSITGLKTPVKMNMSYSAGLNKTTRPQCVFLNNTSQAFGTEGCKTQWEYGQHQVICSCDHLTYFGILMVSSSLSSTDQQILSRITEIGCGISLFCLVVTVFVFYTRRKIKADDSKKIHISLVIALILLNLHFLTSGMVAESSSSGLCLYMALALHYSLLATFCWMGLEGFHLYLLIIKVFNISINRYMLKISVVGWGVPAVIVLLLLSINTEFYGKYTFVDSSNSTSSTICYITNENVKWVTTVGVFGLMFLFVMVVFLLTVRNLMPNCCQKELRQRNWNGLKQNVCTVLVLITLLGITWGIIFFSFGQLTTPSLYVFCILNSLQGFFIFLYFVCFLNKTKDVQTSPSTKSTITVSLDILE